MRHDSIFVYVGAAVELETTGVSFISFSGSMVFHVVYINAMKIDYSAWIASKDEQFLAFAKVICENWHVIYSDKVGQVSSSARMVYTLLDSLGLRKEVRVKFVHEFDQFCDVERRLYFGVF